MSLDFEWDLKSESPEYPVRDFEWSNFKMVKLSDGRDYFFAERKEKQNVPALFWSLDLLNLPEKNYQGLQNDPSLTGNCQFYLNGGEACLWELRQGSFCREKQRAVCQASSEGNAPTK